MKDQQIHLFTSEDGEAVAQVISEYARSWSLLQGYDEQALEEVSAPPTKHAPAGLG